MTEYTFSFVLKGADYRTLVRAKAWDQETAWGIAWAYVWNCFGDRWNQNAGLFPRLYGWSGPSNVVYAGEWGTAPFWCMLKGRHEWEVRRNYEDPRDVWRECGKCGRIEEPRFPQSYTDLPTNGISTNGDPA